MTTRTAYLVQRAAWDFTDWESVPHVIDSHATQGSDFGDHLGPRMVPVALFPSRGAAEHEASRLEINARDGRNPFQFGVMYDDFTALSSAELARRIASLGLTPPFLPFGGTEGEKIVFWSSWWDEHCPNWTREQYAAVWELFDRIRFYEVTEIELED